MDRMINGLIIKSPYIEDILNGKKKYEIRGTNTKIRGKIILLKSGTGLALGTVDVISSEEWDLKKYNSWDYRKDNRKLLVDCLPYKKTYAWKLDNHRWFSYPKKYVHPSVAIVWVKLDDDYGEL